MLYDSLGENWHRENNSHALFCNGLKLNSSLDLQLS